MTEFIKASLPRTDSPDSILNEVSASRSRHIYRDASIGGMGSLSSSFIDHKAFRKTTKDSMEAIAARLRRRKGSEESTLSQQDGHDEFENSSTSSTDVYPSPSHFDNAFAEIPDDAPVTWLMNQLGAKHGWTVDEIQADIATLEKQRIRTVFHLRYLSIQSWKALGLLPIVKDVMQNEIWKVVKRLPSKAK